MRGKKRSSEELNKPQRLVRTPTTFVALTQSRCLDVKMESGGVREQKVGEVICENRHFCILGHLTDG